MAIKVFRSDQLGAPILTGTATPVEAVTPVVVGQVFVDTTAKKVYVAVGLTHADWVEVTNAA